MRRFRKFVNEFDIAGIFVESECLFDVVLERFRNSLAGLVGAGKHDDGFRDFAPVLVRNSDHSSGLDRIVPPERSLAVSGRSDYDIQVVWEREGTTVTLTEASGGS